MFLNRVVFLETVAGTWEGWEGGREGGRGIVLLWGMYIVAGTWEGRVGGRQGGRGGIFFGGCMARLHMCFFTLSIEKRFYS